MAQCGTRRYSLVDFPQSRREKSEIKALTYALSALVSGCFHSSVVLVVEFTSEDFTLMC